MKAFNKDMKHGFNKFRQNINSSHTFRKAYNTLHQVNNYALPVLTGASVIAPQFSPLFGSIAGGLKGAEQITNKIKNKKI